MDADENGKVLFRRNDYGLAITRDELTRCIIMVTESRSMADIFNSIQVQALYRHNTEEFKRTDGSGFCSILSIVGTLSPHLNTNDIMNNIQLREEIANAIEDILIPSVKDYLQPTDYRINKNAHEHEVYRDHTMEHLTRMTSIIRNTAKTYVEEEQWMYVAEVGIVIQAMPIEVTYWEEIRSNNWMTLNLWSSISTEKREQTVSTLQQILKPNTNHIAYAKSHFFNLKEI